MNVRFDRFDGLNATAAPPQAAHNPMFHQNMGVSKPSSINPHNPIRKRVRHRPNRRLRAQSVCSTANSDLSRFTARPSNGTTPALDSFSSKLSEDNLDFYGSMLGGQESAESRDRRMFGGQDDDTESARELRGAMLDVVLGLFNGLDYDDSQMG